MSPGPFSTSLLPALATEASLTGWGGDWEVGRASFIMKPSQMGLCVCVGGGAYVCACLHTCGASGCVCAHGCISVCVCPSCVYMWECHVCTSVCASVCACVCAPLRA